MATSESTSLGGMPPGYREVLYWKIGDSRRRLIAMQILAVPLLFITGILFFGLAWTIGRLPERFDLVPVGLVLTLASLAVTIVLHEWIHGLTMRLLGAQPQYGVMWDKLMFYATSPGYAYRRVGFVAVAVSPLLALSLAAVLGMMLLAGSPWVAVLAICATTNASGAIGDLWILSVILRYPAYAFVVDERDGVRIFLPPA